MQCGACGGQCWPNGSHWQCGSCGALYPKTWSTDALKLDYKESHGWFFVQPDGHLFTISDKTLWKSKEEAIDAIVKYNKEAVNVS